jgi:hypothetical protein
MEVLPIGYFEIPVETQLQPLDAQFGQIVPALVRVFNNEVATPTIYLAQPEGGSTNVKP